eukprot:m.192790 g.192790  ORF g.192790 m.192790 type:complete len:272 (+) comp18275_c0_seq1:1781-2596(+)
MKSNKPGQVRLRADDGMAQDSDNVTKRPRETKEADAADGGAAEPSVVLQAFQQYADKLTAKHDRHERLVKVSRDITIQSKRVISNLQRLQSDKQRAVKVAEAQGQLAAIHKLFAKMASELSGVDPNVYARAVSPGVQEFVEAATFCEFIATGQLASLEQINSDIGAEGFSVSVRDYLLGVTDLTGELMRLCITSVGSPSFSPDTGARICAFCQTLSAAYGLIVHTYGKEMSKKMEVLKQSLKKIENACYLFKVRGSELPAGGLADALKADT